MTGDLYDHGDYQTISLPGYMYLGFFKPTPIDVPAFPFEFGDSVILGPMQKIQKIGDKRPGFTSAGSAVVEMQPGSFFTFAGTFTRNDGRLILFHSWKDGDLQFVPDRGDGKIPGTPYAQMYVAFFDTDPSTLLFQKAGQTSRIVSKVLQFTEEK